MTIKWILPTTLPIFRFNPTAAVGNPFMWNPMSKGISSSTFRYHTIMPMPTFNFKFPLFSNPTLTLNNSSKSTRLNGGFGENIVSTAKKYIGFNERDNSYKLFTNGRNEAWCADFTSYVVKEACRKSGKTLPSGFGSASVEGLRQWGKQNGCYLDTANAANKTEKIKQNVKPGDLIIFKENGKSHTGIVKNVGADGSITTIEGNTSDKVAERCYAANNNTISGFVQLA